ncbi:MAG: tyrosine-type recombinase/integrase [Thermoguttaceae bacterium]
MSRIPTVRQHQKGYFFIRIEGKDHYLGHEKVVANQKADLLLADYLKRRHQSCPTQIEELLIEEIGVRFLLWAKEYYQYEGRDTGVYTRCRLAIQLLIDNHARNFPSQFGPLALKRLRESMIEAGLALSTINARINIIRQCFRWGAENELCNAAVYQTLQSVRGLQKGRSNARNPKKVLPVPLSVIEATLPFLPPTVKDMVMLQMHSGMRSGELINLMFEDIDRSKAVWRYTPKTHKTARYEKSRTVRFGPESQKILQPYFDEAGESLTGYVFDPRRTVALSLQRRRRNPPKERREEHLPQRLKRKPGDKYRRDSYRTAIQRACVKAGVEKWFPHQLRHLAGTLAREIGGLDGAQHFLGHSSAVVTQIYAEVNDAKADAVAEKIG